MLLLGPVVLSGALLATVATALGDFQAPAGWTRTDAPSSSATRAIATWQIAGDTSTSITFIVDASASFADTMAAMNKNFSDNAIRLGVNRDLPCRGTTAHVVEFTSGPDGARTIFNRLVVPEGAGVATITYTRMEGNAFEADVRKSEQTFCALPPYVASAASPAP